MDRTKRAIEQEYGFISWWGYSPAMDLTFSDSSPAILLFGASDPRHVLAGSSGSHPTYFISESNINLYARSLVLLSILYGPNEEATRIQRFLFIYGNSLLDRESADFLGVKCKELSESVIKSRNVSSSDPSYSRISIGSQVILDLSRLKYKEIDALQLILQNWSTRVSKREKKLISFFDMRNRSLLGPRYGCRDGVFDMDYEMRFKDKFRGISSKEYKYWRSTGISFLPHEKDPKDWQDNVTLISVNIAKNSKLDKVGIEGYWSDIVSGSPFLGFGTKKQEISISPQDSRNKCFAFDNAMESLQTLLSTSTQKTLFFLPMSFAENVDFTKYKIPRCKSIFIGNSKSHLMATLLTDAICDELILETLDGLITLSKDIYMGFRDKVKNAMRVGGYEVVESSDLYPFILHLTSK